MDKNYLRLVEDIGKTFSSARDKVVNAVNFSLVSAYWEIGRHIVEYEQDGNQRAEYGSELLDKLSRDLTLKYGKGFGRRNVLDMRRFFLSYPIWQTVSAKLSWSHFVVLLGIENNKARIFYESKCLEANWSVRELERQVDSSLFERTGPKRTKKTSVIVKKPKQVLTQKDIIKDPYVLDFLKIPSSFKLTEKKFEQKIINNLQLFLLELGKGFAFIGRQYKISIRNVHYYVDLVFYHRILKCFVLIDLKGKRNFR